MIKLNGSNSLCWLAEERESSKGLRNSSFQSQSRSQSKSLTNVNINDVEELGEEETSDNTTPGFVIKSESDSRNYLAVTLKNRIKALLISDPGATKCAASLSVQAGSLLDPKEIPGLSHLCQQMLFQSNQNLDKVTESGNNGFEKFLASNRGEFSAFTRKDLTTFSFDVDPLVFVSSLHQFAQCLLSPSFDDDVAFEQSVNAIHQEFEKNLPIDEDRRTRVEESCTRSDHSYSQFDCGNTLSLWTRPKGTSINLKEALQNFYEKHYSANRMFLVLYGKGSCEELQVLAEDTFGAIKNKNIAIPTFGSPYGSDELKTRIEIVPIIDMKRLFLVFPVPDQTENYKSGVTTYATFLLGHEGHGSLLALLREEGWSHRIAIEYKRPAKKFAFMTMDIELTHSGLKNVNNILHNIFQYLKLLRVEGPKYWIWKELQLIKQLQFRFLDKERERILYYVENLASQMPDYPSYHYLVGKYFIQDYKPGVMRDFINYLVPSNFRFIVSSKQNDNIADEVEEWYNVKYKYSKIDKSHIKKWKNCILHDDLRLPTPNKFLPTGMKLKPRNQKCLGVPRIIEDNPLSRVWFLQDNEFKYPYATIILAILSPMPKQQADFFNSTRLIEKIVNDSLIGIACDAKNAGMVHRVEATLAGLTISVHGYSVKIAMFFDYVLNSLFHFCSVGKVGLRFKDIKDEYVQHLSDWKNEEPYIHAVEYVWELLNSHTWSPEQLLDAMNDDVSPYHLMLYAQKFLSSVKLQWMFYGDLTEEEALYTYKSGMKYFELLGSKPIPATQTVGAREAILPAQSTTVYKAENPTHAESCVVILLQTGHGGVRETALTELVEFILHTPAIEYLRTDEQIVWTDVRKSRVTLGFQIILQDEKDPEELENKIEEFLYSIEEKLETMLEKDFIQFRKALQDRKLERPKSMKLRGLLLFDEIIRENYNFHRQQQELAELEKIELKDLVHFYKENIVPDGPKRKKLCVQVASTLEKEEIVSLQNNSTEIMESIEMNEMDQDTAILPQNPQKTVTNNINEQPKNDETTTAAGTSATTTKTPVSGSKANLKEKESASRFTLRKDRIAALYSYLGSDIIQDNNWPMSPVDGGPEKDNNPNSLKKVTINSATVETGIGNPSANTANQNITSSIVPPRPLAFSNINIPNSNFPPHIHHQSILKKHSSVNDDLATSPVDLHSKKQNSTHISFADKTPRILSYSKLQSLGPSTNSTKPTGPTSTNPNPTIPGTTNGINSNSRPRTTGQFPMQLGNGAPPSSDPRGSTSHSLNSSNHSVIHRPRTFNGVLGNTSTGPGQTSRNSKGQLLTSTRARWARNHNIPSNFTNPPNVNLKWKPQTNKSFILRENSVIARSITSGNYISLSEQHHRNLQTLSQSNTMDALRNHNKNLRQANRLMARQAAKKRLDELSKRINLNLTTTNPPILEKSGLENVVKTSSNYNALDSLLKSAMAATPKPLTLNLTPGPVKKLSCKISLQPSSHQPKSICKIGNNRLLPNKTTVNNNPSNLGTSSKSLKDQQQLQQQQQLVQQQQQLLKDTIDFRDYDFDFEEEIRRLRELKKYVQFKEQERIKQKEEATTSAAGHQNYNHGQTQNQKEENNLQLKFPEMKPGFNPLHEIRRLRNLKKVLDEEIHKQQQQQQQHQIHPLAQISTSPTNNTSKFSTPPHVSPFLNNATKLSNMNFGQRNSRILMLARRHSKTNGRIFGPKNAHSTSSTGQGHSNSNPNSNPSGRNNLTGNSNFKGSTNAQGANSVNNDTLTVHEVEREIQRLKNIKKYFDGETRELNLHNVEYTVFVLNQITYNDSAQTKELLSRFLNSHKKNNPHAPPHSAASSASNAPTSSLSNTYHQNQHQNLTLSTNHQNPNIHNVSFSGQTQTTHHISSSIIQIKQDAASRSSLSNQNQNKNPNSSDSGSGPSSNANPKSSLNFLNHSNSTAIQHTQQINHNQILNMNASSKSISNVINPNISASQNIIPSTLIPNPNQPPIFTFSSFSSSNNSKPTAKLNISERVASTAPYFHTVQNPKTMEMKQIRTKRKLNILTPKSNPSSNSSSPKPNLHPHPHPHSHSHSKHKQKSSLNTFKFSDVNIKFENPKPGPSQSRNSAQRPTTKQHQQQQKSVPPTPAKSITPRKNRSETNVNLKKKTQSSVSSEHENKNNFTGRRNSAVHSTIKIPQGPNSSNFNIFTKNTNNNNNNVSKPPVSISNNVKKPIQTDSSSRKNNTHTVKIITKTGQNSNAIPSSSTIKSNNINKINVPATSTTTEKTKLQGKKVNSSTTVAAESQKQNQSLSKSPVQLVKSMTGVHHVSKTNRNSNSPVPSPEQNSNKKSENSEKIDKVPTAIAQPKLPFEPQTAKLNLPPVSVVKKGEENSTKNLDLDGKKHESTKSNKKADDGTGSIKKTLEIKSNLKSVTTKAGESTATSNSNNNKNYTIKVEQSKEKDPNPKNEIFNAPKLHEVTKIKLEGKVTTINLGDMKQIETSVSTKPKPLKNSLALYHSLTSNEPIKTPPMPLSPPPSPNIQIQSNGLRTSEPEITEKGAENLEILVSEPIVSTSEQPKNEISEISPDSVSVENSTNNPAPVVVQSQEKSQNETVSIVNQKQDENKDKSQENLHSIPKPAEQHLELKTKEITAPLPKLVSPPEQNTIELKPTTKSKSKFKIIKRTKSVDKHKVQNENQSRDQKTSLDQKNTKPDQSKASKVNPLKKVALALTKKTSRSDKDKDKPIKSPSQTQSIQKLNANEVNSSNKNTNKKKKGKSSTETNLKLEKTQSPVSSLPTEEAHEKSPIIKENIEPTQITEKTEKQEERQHNSANSEQNPLSSSPIPINVQNVQLQMQMLIQPDNKNPLGATSFPTEDSSLPPFIPPHIKRESLLIPAKTNNTVPSEETDHVAPDPDQLSLKKSMNVKKKRKETEDGAVENQENIKVSLPTPNSPDPTPDLLQWMNRVVSLEMQQCIKSLAHRTTKKIKHYASNNEVPLLPVLYNPPPLLRELPSETLTMKECAKRRKKKMRDSFPEKGGGSRKHTHSASSHPENPPVVESSEASTFTEGLRYSVLDTELKENLVGSKGGHKTSPGEQPSSSKTNKPILPDRMKTKHSVKVVNDIHTWKKTAQYVDGPKVQITWIPGKGQRVHQNIQTDR